MKRQNYNLYAYKNGKQRVKQEYTYFGLANLTFTLWTVTSDKVELWQGKHLVQR